MGAETNQQYQERFTQVQKELSEESDEAFMLATTLLQDVFKTGGEQLQQLQESIDALQGKFDQVVESKVSLSKAASELRETFRTVKGKLNLLKAQVGPVLEEQEDKKWYEKLLGGGGSFSAKYSSIATGLAFSIGGVLKQMKNFFAPADGKDGKQKPGMFAKIQSFLASLITVDRIEVATAMQSYGFEGIDSSKGNLGNVISRLKTDLTSMNIEQFSELLAKAARKKYPDKNVKILSYEELAEIAETIEDPKAPKPKAETATESPNEEPPQPTEVADVQIGSMLNSSLKIANKTVQVSTDGKFTVDSYTWQLKTATGSVKVSDAVITADKKLNLSVDVAKNTYSTSMSTLFMKELFSKMASSENEIDPLLLMSNDNKELKLEIASTS